jgi:hypothetical protein
MPPPEVDIKAYEEELAKEQAALAKNPPFRSEPLPRLPKPLPDLLEDMGPPSSAGEVQWTRQWEGELEWDRDVTSGRDFLRLNALDAAKSVLSWERPLTVHLDHTRPLLANGKYQDEYSYASFKIADQRKRKHREEEADGEEEETRAGDDNHGDNASDTETITPTKRITRSAAKKQSGTAKPTARKPAGKPASKPASKPARKPASKPARKPARKPAARKLTRKAAHARADE